MIVGLIPIIGRQTSLLIGELPKMISGLRDLAVALPERYAEYVSPEQFQSITERLSEEVGRLLEQALSFSISSFPRHYRGDDLSGVGTPISHVYA